MYPCIKRNARPNNNQLITQPDNPRLRKIEGFAFIETADFCHCHYSNQFQASNNSAKLKL